MPDNHNFIEMLKTNSRKIRSISSDKPTYIYDASLNELEDIDLFAEKTARAKVALKNVKLPPR